MADYFKKYKSLHSTTLSSSIGTGTGETITFASVTNVPTDTEITVTIDRVDSSGTATASKMERITGTLSGSNLTSYTREVDYSTEQAHSAGAVVEMVWNAADWNDAIDGILVEHGQNGTHYNITASNISASAITATSLNIGASTLVSSILDEDTMSSNSASAIATQQSIKAYIDSGTVTPTSITTFTNKRITKREGTSASAATHTIDADSYDIFTVTAQAEAVTFGAPSGTPTDGQTLVIRIKDNGTARAITWNAAFTAGDISLPTTTVLSKTMYVGFMWNADASKWQCLAVVDNF